MPAEYRAPLLRGPSAHEHRGSTFILALLVLVGCKRDDPPTEPAPPSSGLAAAPESAPLDAVPPVLRVGYDNACLVADEGVLCWGSNRTAKLGRGVGEPCGQDGSCVATPTRIAAFEDAVDVALGNTQTCLMNAEGGVSCLGSHDQGQLGLADTVAGVCTLGGYASPRCSLDLETEQVHCAGTTQVPEVKLPCIDEPTPVPGLATAAAIRADGPSCVVTEAGALWCAGGLGLDAFAELPERCGKYDDPCTRRFIELVPGEVADVGFGTYGGCVRMTDGRVRCESTQLGVLAGVDDALSMSVGGQHVCVVRGDHTVTCAGWNASGQLGLGTKDEPAAPARVAAGRLDDATAVAVGADFSCGLRKGGELWCWGSGSAGQLGQGDGVDHYEPVKVPGLPPVAQVEAGGDFVCILGTDYSVWCWGSNDRGQLGIGMDRGTTCKTERIFQPVIPCAVSPVKLAFPDRDPSSP